jgi:crotonobetainyl-CoA:carnitine CoA-transferase CaiB-like acyl-CoA transferase
MALLEGIRVLDFGRYIAGPYCATLLGEYGADVIRIEKTQGSEDRFVAPVAQGEEGALFLQMNRNKRCLTLDPTCTQGRDVVKRLVASADIVVANLPEPMLRAMGLDYPSLCAIKSDIILVTSSAFGAVGPMVNNVGFDGVAQAMCGSAYMTGQIDEPYRACVNWVDFGTALHCAFGAMAALRARDQTGKGQVVSGSLLATAVSFANSAMIEQAVIAPNRLPSGNRGQTAGPVDIVHAQDGGVLIQVVGQPLFERWARLMGEPEWLTDPRFASDSLRGIHGHLLSERTTQWCSTRTVAQAIAELGAAKIPCAAVLSPQQALDDPQIAAMGLLNPLEYPGLPRPAPVSRAAVSLSESEKVPLRRAPMLAEHTQEILLELGFDHAEIAHLRAAAVV